MCEKKEITMKYKTGDKVRCIDRDAYGFTYGEVYVVNDVENYDSEQPFKLIDDGGDERWPMAHMFEYEEGVSAPKPTSTPIEINAELPLTLRRYPNGGWVVEQIEHRDFVPEQIGAFSTAKEMLAALGVALAD